MRAGCVFAVSADSVSQFAHFKGSRTEDRHRAGGAEGTPSGGRAFAVGP